MESADGDVGWVDQLWLGEDGDVRALAVRTVDGRHGLLPREAVEAVDRENRWVVISPGEELLELAPPRVTGADGHEATWQTTGAVISAPSEPPWRWPLHLPHLGTHRHPYLEALSRRVRRWPPWLAVAALIGALTFLLALMMTLAFIVARLVTGEAY